VTVERNVIYNIMGGAYFLEDGVEIGNVFQHNLAVFVKTSSSLLNEDVTPAAFWATNPNNTYLHNAVAGGTHFGFWYRLTDRPEGPSFRTDYCPKKIPLGLWSNNTVHSTGRFGLWIFPGYTPTPTGSCSDSSPAVATFSHMQAYGNDKGGEAVNSNAVVFRNFTVWDMSSAGVETKLLRFNSVENSWYGATFYSPTVGNSLVDSVVIGNSEGGPARANSGVSLAWDRGQLLKNVAFYNFPNEEASAIDVTSINGVCT